MHSVRAVEESFSGHGFRLVELERAAVSTTLVPAAIARGLRGRPALAPPPPRRAGFVLVVVVTDREWLRNIDRHAREAERTIAGTTGPADWSSFSTRRDNVFLVYPRGAPRNIKRLEAALDDVE